MRAVVCTKYGAPDVLELKEVTKPFPKDNEIQIKVFATTVTTGDCRIRSFTSPLLLWLPMRIVLGFTKPRNPILGVELAGEVELVGKKVTRFKVGDQVYALSGMRCGAHAEYICMSEQAVVALKPDNASYEEAAVLPFGGTTALHFFRKGNIKAGMKVLIYGASGSVGTAAVQLATYFGAEVTGVCSGRNIDLVQSLGAKHVIDYTKEDFTESAERFDVIFDAIGKSSKSHCTKVLAPNGKYLTVDGQGIAKVSADDLVFLKELMEKGKLKAVIDRRYSLEQVPEAHRYVETGRKKGNIVITVQ
ncbi:NAD(P)-dependent alcohol dehydrogenase [Paenibacillus agilis]|uniref:NAD(P)-dependent alcohol dehydrogenase n=1 Tax=Paenibacillus agilis TaxID=3020863 RepID=A0A559J1L3_9BACL|nr:NAD(P)-dependent alcohol dehydrogenase [Paenibacillus agilis]TVX93775.1 NAD(P)-dependent alcohol dehydrogenase [Paenibacillus agilis]